MHGNRMQHAKLLPMCGEIKAQLRGSYGVSKGGKRTLLGPVILLYSQTMVSSSRLKGLAHLFYCWTVVETLYTYTVNPGASLSSSVGTLVCQPRGPSLIPGISCSESARGNLIMLLPSTMLSWNATYPWLLWSCVGEMKLETTLNFSCSTSQS